MLPDRGCPEGSDPRPRDATGPRGGRNRPEASRPNRCCTRVVPKPRHRDQSRRHGRQPTGRRPNPRRTRPARPHRDVSQRHPNLRRTHSPRPHPNRAQPRVNPGRTRPIQPRPNESRKHLNRSRPNPNPRRTRPTQPRPDGSRTRSGPGRTLRNRSRQNQGHQPATTPQTPRSHQDHSHPNPNPQPNREPPNGSGPPAAPKAANSPHPEPPDHPGPANLDHPARAGWRGRGDAGPRTGRARRDARDGQAWTGTGLLRRRPHGTRSQGDRE